MIRVKVLSPINIAVLKYWGKSNEEDIIPMNTSLSITLDTDSIYSKTIVSCSEAYQEDAFELNGKKEELTKRMVKIIRLARAEAQKMGLDQAEWKLHINSHNNFPTAAGLASSASGMSAFASALGELYGFEKTLVTSFARLGSGSACRSVFGGFVEWTPTPSVIQLFPPEHWPELRILICQVNSRHKSVSSTDGMQCTVATSELYQYRVSHLVAQHRNLFHAAIQQHDFAAFAKITMRESNQLHAVCLDSDPPIAYLTDASHCLIQWAHLVNHMQHQEVVAYTFDAGCNAFLFCLEVNVMPLLQSLWQLFSRLGCAYDDFVIGYQHSTNGCEINDILNNQPAPPSIVENGKGIIDKVICCRVGNGPVVCKQ